MVPCQLYEVLESQYRGRPAGEMLMSWEPRALHKGHEHLDVSITTEPPFLGRFENMPHRWVAQIDLRNVRVMLA